jgi:competence protein ComEC
MNSIIGYRQVFLFVVLGGAAFVIWYAVFYYESRGDLVMHFFDVGQGDAIFFDIPGGYQVLIDGGPSAAVLSKLGTAMPFWDRSLDLVILTHPDKDHITGLLDVLRRYRVDMILWSGVEHTSAEYREWLRLTGEEGAEIILARVGQRLMFGDGTALDILAPFIDDEGNLIGGVNETSVVGMMRRGGTKILLMGDAGKMTERRLLFEQGENLDTDILKVGHHGSNTSSLEEFLQMISPDIAVISAGRDNRYGHPHADVLERLEATGTVIRRTDVEGDIMLVSNGDYLWLEY